MILSVYAASNVIREAHAVKLSLWVAVIATILAVVISVSRLRGQRHDLQAEK